MVDKAGLLELGQARQAGTQEEEESDYKGVLIGDLPEVERLKRFDRLKRDLSHLNQRWNDRLACQRLSFAKQYLRCGLSVVCYFHWGRQGRHGDPACFINGDRCVGKNNIIAAVYEASANESLDGCNRNDEQVLVNVTEFAGGPNRYVPSVVRHYLVENDFGEIGQGFLYKSIRLGGYKIVPFGAVRKREPITLFREYLNDCVVEGGGDIVDGVADGKCHLSWRLCDRIELDEVLARSCLFLNVDLAEVRLQKCVENCLNLIDVAIGPLDL